MASGIVVGLLLLVLGAVLVLCYLNAMLLTQKNSSQISVEQPIGASDTFSMRGRVEYLEGKIAAHAARSSANLSHDILVLRNRLEDLERRNDNELTRLRLQSRQGLPGDILALRRQVERLEARFSLSSSSHSRDVDSAVSKEHHADKDTLRSPAQPFWWSAGQQPCTKDLGDFSSQDAMRAAGWTLDLSNMQTDANFLGWKSGDLVGSMQVTLNGSGRIKLLITTNNFPDRGNSITASMVGRFGKLNLIGTNDHDINTCIRFKHGDQLTITEKYSQIYLRTANVVCSSEDPATNSPCASGLKVRVGGFSCNQSDWSEATIQKVLNETRATVRLGTERDTRIVSASEVFPMDDQPIDPSLASFSEKAAGLLPEPRSCGRFKFRRKAIGMVVLADRQFQKSYAGQIQSLRCFASWRKYDFFIFDSSDFPYCQRFRSVFFFQKHCIVSEFLKTQLEDYVAVIVDADVVAVALERGVEEWLEKGEDFIFYERNGEIAAGNYLVRNTEWSRTFLMVWAEFIKRQPSGFSSADNGAIHLHIVESLKYKDAGICAKQYAELTALVDNLNPYFAFVRCTKNLLKPPGSWSVNTDDGGKGRIAILAERQNWVVDEDVATYTDLTGPVMYHGIKQAYKLSRYYANLSECRLVLRNGQR